MYATIIKEALEGMSDQFILTNFRSAKQIRKISKPYSVTLFSRCNSSPYDFYQLLYPGRFKQWQFNRVPKYFWDDLQNVKDYLEWRIERGMPRDFVYGDIQGILRQKYSMDHLRSLVKKN
ncbi:hypothetical protein D3C78_19940 [compost metagenome]